MVLSICMTVCMTKEVEVQALNLVGADSFSSLNVVEILQQRNGSDMEVSGRITDIICIAQITCKFINNALPIYNT